MISCKDLEGNVNAIIILRSRHIDGGTGKNQAKAQSRKQAFRQRIKRKTFGKRVQSIHATELCSVVVVRVCLWSDRLCGLVVRRPGC
jgi:hypothetical protein